MENGTDPRFGSGPSGHGTVADGTDDPAVAFAALQATVDRLAVDLGREMATIRKGVEAAFDRLDQQGAAVDYGADLGRLVNNLSAMGERLAAIERSPLLRQGAEHQARVLERSGEGLVRNAVQGLERQAADLERLGHTLMARLAGAREQRQQNGWLAGVAGVGLLLGMMLTLFLPRVLPFSAAPRLASLVMGQPAWQAGMSLMGFDSPASWSRVAEADRLIAANKDTVAACREAAVRTGKEQRCSITVAGPERAP